LGARFTTPVLKDGFLYGSSGGHLFCANAQTGATLWDESASLGDAAAIVDAGPVLFRPRAKGQLMAFKPGNHLHPAGATHSGHH